MNIVVSTTAKFHSFDLARELLKRGRLSQLYSAYPSRKLRTENIPANLLTCYPSAYVQYLVSRRLNCSAAVTRELFFRSQVSFARRVARSIVPGSAFTGMSGSSLEPGLRTQEFGFPFILRRGSTHIEFQDNLLFSEYKRWDLPFIRTDKRIIERELKEYESADLIAVPSGFSRASFLSKGVPEDKLFSTPYGVNLERFKPAGEAPIQEFNLAFIGEFSLRKGIPYLLQAFRKLRHPQKKLTFMGGVDRDLYRLMNSRGLLSGNIEFLGHVAQQEIPSELSRAHALVLPSIEDGFGVVMAQALACGVPVIASSNTGASDLFEDGVEGFIVPAGDADMLTERFETLAQDQVLLSRMRQAALARVEFLGGWNTYGNRITEALNKASN